MIEAKDPILYELTVGNHRIMVSDSVVSIARLQEYPEGPEVEDPKAFYFQIPEMEVLVGRGMASVVQLLAREIIRLREHV